jgi:transcription antitermination factor NusG
MAMQWFCAMTLAGKETLTKLSLDQKEFQTYLPMIKKTLKRGVVDRPFVPGYLFVQADTANPQERWREIVSTFGIKGLVPPGADRPQAVPNWIIEGLQAREVYGVIQLDPQETCDFKRGDKVRLQGSPLDALFEKTEGRDRAVILISLFNKNLPKTVMLNRLQASVA